MLEIQSVISQESKGRDFKSFDAVYQSGKKSKIRRWAFGLLGGLVILMFLPWTQNIRARGTVTTLRQEHRPQELHAIISGRVVKWYVKEGDMVKAGDTIAQLAEVKDAYLDPRLLERTEAQIQAKSASVTAYGDKAAATASQMTALQASRELKIQQIQNKLRQLTLKLQADSMEMVSSLNDLHIADAQYKRQRALRDSGLSSLQQVEQRSASYQQAIAKKTAAEIKFHNTKTDLLTAGIEMQSANQEYAEKLYKAQGDRATAQSEIATGQGEIAKLSNQYANYSIRSGQYFLRAPQDGQVIGASKQGINEIVKEGEPLCQIVPQHIDYAVELFVRPVDLPLLAKGQHIRFQFDGYPAIIFSGWPSASYGMFDGRVIAIETAVNANGKARVLIAEDSASKPWPRTMSLGTGAQGIALLKNVPIGYELWRNINGFPPDYYTVKPEQDEKKK